MQKNVDDQAAFRLVLENEFAGRLRRNPRYSLRAFARFLGVSPALLSLLLSDQRRLTPKTARKMARALSLPESTVLSSRNSESDYNQLSLDTFSLISTWHHYAILSLLEIKGFQLDSRWLSRRLGISEGEASLAVGRLKRLGLLVKKNGKWKQGGGPILVKNTDSTPATRKYHRQILEKAQESLENDPFNIRDLSVTTLAMSSKDVAYARERIRKFRHQLCRELEGRGGPDSVYQLAVQIFPVTKEV